MNVYGLDVFLSSAREREITKEVSRDKPALWVVSSTIAGSPDSAEREQLIRAWLATKHNQDPAAFRREWYEFRIVGDEASKDVWDLLYDWCSRTGGGYLADERDEHGKLMAMWSSDAYSHPMGRIFTINHRVPVPQAWWRQLISPRYSTVKIFIDVSQIRSLVGTLDRFVVAGAGFAIIFSENVRVVFGSSE
ncbi:MAG: hypothetical protein O9319_14625 [Gemmatimonas sp.]|uniref:hypothetical protein n=1 Tax=Gemmatimonas sp. TaxID=1962908 RepID=UPI0022C597B2|nr:hypothetical protein [Gemmatimonas sp.]MCZ8013840.1 hypothetical protein [Gemmatimonas sp.]MCZ8268088.1 hypothetical protein [Gemmatimonas sp.]